MSEEETAKKLKPFRICIPGTSMVKYPKPTWDRFINFVDSIRSTDVEAVMFHDRPAHMWIVDGNGTSRMIAILMAAAHGHDLDSLLDEFEKEDK